jgi:hypothetical protein
MLGLAALWLASPIISDGVNGLTLETWPDSPVVRRSASDARVLAAAADDALAAATTRSDLQNASDLASQALAGDTTQVSALRDLGLIAARRGQPDRAKMLMTLAGRRSPLDGATHLWLLIHCLASGDYGAAFQDADVLLRHAPNLTPKLFPLFVAYAAPARVALETRLATNPPWGPDVLMMLVDQTPDPGVVQAILSDLQDTPAKPTPAEWTAYFARRIKDRAYELAYFDWLRTLPPAAMAQAKSVYDGDFVGLPGVPPFNWRLGGGLGGEADLARESDQSTHALHVLYEGYGAPELAEQLLVLAPGSYQFSGESRALTNASAALAWEIFCADDSGDVLARVAAPAAPGDWRPFSAPVQVPPTGCRAQWLRLTPAPADHVRPLEVWYRRLAVERVGASS